jgi:predicted ATP-grasp superfamily ATP-dependent carboligase
VELLRRVGHTGPAIAEFKLDPRDGRPKFIEANGRSVLYNALLRRAGLDQAGMAWAEHVEGRRERAQPNGWPGAWVNLHADVLYTLLRRREQRIGPLEFARPYARPLIEAVWSPSDPQPFLAQWGRTARTAMRRP